MKKYLLFLLMSTNCFSYEWFQMTDNGLSHRSVNVKTESKKKTKINFEDLNIGQRKEIDYAKQFPNLNNPQKIILIGDTGCRLKDNRMGSSGEYQDCDDKKAWPFESIMKKIDAEKSDLIVHLGDYHYREKCTHGTFCEKIGDTGYGWLPWELDFFKPTEETLKHTPIIIVRGNHEDCERAHEGYRLMLSNEKWEKDCKQMEAPQIIELGDITFVNIDSSNVDDKPNFSGPQEAEWIEALNKVNKKLDEHKRKNVWIISHKPIYGMAPFTKTYVPLNLNLRKYLEKSELIKKVQYIFSGHVHTSMIVKGDNFPMQIVLGDGGTKLTDMSTPINENMLKFFKYKSAEIVQGGFGYMMMTKKDKHWTMEFKDAEGRTVKAVDL